MPRTLTSKAFRSFFGGFLLGKPWENGDLYGQIQHFVAGNGI
jgi:hypothetical protein